jgi:hypothetical protein
MELPGNARRLLSGLSPIGVCPMLQLNDLQNRIARLELRIEQLRIHLQSLDRGSSEATEVRSMLFGMLQDLVALKEGREHLEAELDLEEAA